MKVTCDKVEEAIRDFARNGVEPAAEIRLHIESCKSCSEALELAKTDQAAFDCLKPYPQVPDCRMIVQQMIGERRPALPGRLVWSAVPAAISIILAVGLFTSSRKEPVSRTQPDKVVVQNLSIANEKPEIGNIEPKEPPKVVIPEVENRNRTHNSKTHRTKIERPVIEEKKIANVETAVQEVEAVENPVIIAMTGEINARFSREFLAEKGVPEDALQPSDHRQSQVILMASRPDGSSKGYALSPDGDVRVSNLRPGTYDLALQVSSEKTEQIIMVKENVPVNDWEIVRIEM